MKIEIHVNIIVKSNNIIANGKSRVSYIHNQYNNAKIIYK
jgi:hypothetical protein